MEPFLPQGHNLKNLGSGLVGDATYQIARLKPCAFRQEYFFMLYYISLCKTYDPEGDNFVPIGII